MPSSYLGRNSFDFREYRVVRTQNVHNCVRIAFNLMSFQRGTLNINIVGRFFSRSSSPCSHFAHAANVINYTCR